MAAKRVLVLVVLVSLIAGFGWSCARAVPQAEKAKPEPESTAPAEPDRSSDTRPGDITPRDAKPLSLPSRKANFKITPLSPGVKGSNVLATGELEIRAMIEFDKSTKPMCVRLELNGNRLDTEMLESKDVTVDPWRRLLVRAEPGHLKDGNYTARVYIEDMEGRWSEEKWSFTVATQPMENPEGDLNELTLYFADDPLVAAGFPAEWGFVRPVRRQVAKTTRPALRAVEELIAGPRPEDGEVGRTIPSTARVIGVSIKDGVAYVNFSREFSRDHPGGTTGGAITVQSVLYTLTEFPTVEAVQVLVEGEPWSDGHFIWDKPLRRPSPRLERVRISDCD